MSYTPTVWKTGDIVSSAKLNKIETELSALDEGLASAGSDISGVETALAVLEPTATSSDVGKALKVKTVSDGKVTEYEFGETGSSNAAPVIVDTATGAIASFPDGADGMPFQKIVAEIEPVQDLHGYDNPWPAGGGKNKLDLSGITPGKSENGITFTVNSDGTVTANGTATGQCQIYWSIPAAKAQTFAGLKSSVVGSGKGGIYYELSTSPYTQFLDGSTFIVDSSIANVTANVNLIWRISTGVTLSNYTWGPMLYDPSISDATYAPYANICPISGHTGVDVTRAGKNLVEAIEHYNIAADGTIAEEPSYDCVVAQVKQGQTYKVSINGVGIRPQTFAWFASLPAVGSVAYDGTRHLDDTSTFVAPIDGYFVGRYNTGTEKLQFELGSTATDYEPFRGNSYSVTFGEIVYGASPDVVSGEMPVTMVKVTFDENTTGIYQQLRPNEFAISLPVAHGVVSATDYLCNSLKKVASASQWATATVGSCLINPNLQFLYILLDDEINTVALCKEWLGENNVEICYKRATPIQTTITPTPITALQGQNNVWTSAGDVTVNYPADTKLYIDKKIAAAVAALS